MVGTKKLCKVRVGTRRAGEPSEQSSCVYHVIISFSNCLLCILASPLFRERSERPRHLSSSLPGLTCTQAPLFEQRILLPLQPTCTIKFDCCCPNVLARTSKRSSRVSNKRDVDGLRLPQYNRWPRPRRCVLRAINVNAASAAIMNTNYSPLPN
ncbi:hypothetical protein J6590_033743 [Homalodisca vitripennis]|nr:hypothetical protein J6590_033743 [Homalodisca vitripennis]